MHSESVDAGSVSESVGRPSWRGGDHQDRDFQLGHSLHGLSPPPLKALWEAALREAIVTEYFLTP
jgi:hypothetical protein